MGIHVWLLSSTFGHLSCNICLNHYCKHQKLLVKTLTASLLDYLPMDNLYLYLLLMLLLTISLAYPLSLLFVHYYSQIRLVL